MSPWLCCDVHFRGGFLFRDPITAGRELLLGFPTEDGITLCIWDEKTGEKAGRMCDTLPKDTKSY